MKRASALAMVVAFVCCHAAGAADWVPVATAQNGAVFHANADRVEVISPYILRAWIKATPASNTDEGGAMGRYELLCKVRQYKTLAFTLYSKDGSVRYSKPREDVSYTEITPDSVMETVLETVCRVFGRLE